MVSRFLKKAAQDLVKEAVKELQKTLLETFKDIILGSTTLDQKELVKLVAQIDKMTGEEFEQFLSICFKRLGYVVRNTPKSNDFGADLILTKNGIKTVVQAKRYQNKVGSGAVQEVVGAIKYYGANNAIVITNSKFTSSARALARPNLVELWDREKLIELIIMAKDKPEV